MPEYLLLKKAQARDRKEKTVVVLLIFCELQRGLWFPRHKRHRVMANSCLTFTYNTYNMLNITSMLKIPLKMSSPHFLLANIETQQIQNNLTQFYTKLWCDNPTKTTWTEIKPVPQGQTSDRRWGSTLFPYALPVCTDKALRFWSTGLICQLHLKNLLKQLLIWMY